MRYHTFLFIFYFLTNQYLTAQKSVLSLRTCVERAQNNSFLIHAGEKKIEAAQKNYQYIRYQSLPQINGQLSTDYHKLDPYSFNQKSALLTIDWSPGDFFLNTAQMAKHDKLIAQTEMEQQRLDVSLRCALLYIHILQQLERRELMKRRLTLLDTHYNVAEALWQSGIRTRFDLLQTETEIARLKEDMTYLELDHQNYIQELGQLIGEKNPGDIEIQPLDTKHIYNRPLPEISTATIERLPAIESYKLRIKAQQLHTRIVTAQELPHLNVFGGFMQDGDPAGDGNYWQTGAGISLPVFRWKAASFQKQESKVLSQALDFQKQETERNISVFIAQIQQKLAKLKDVIQLQHQRLKITENAFKIADANYQAGLITNLEYLAAQQQLNETQFDIQKTQLEYTGALIQFYITTNQAEKINEL